MIAYHHVYNLINNRGSGKVSDETKEPICILQEARGLIGFPLPERPRRLSTQSRLSSGGGGRLIVRREQTPAPGTCINQHV